MTIAQGAKRAAATCLMPLVRRAARAYAAGENADDAIRASRRLAARGMLTSIGYWDDPEDSADRVLRQYLAGLEALAVGPPTGKYLSIKLPALRFDRALVDQVARRAAELGVKLHFDSLWPETADPTREVIDSLALRGGLQIGCTLPSRWARSPADAAWACRLGLAVRVVKGQWPDPAHPDLDPHTGYLQVIEELAGRARHVGVATHDTPLAAAAIRRLQATGTPCEMELLYGLPMRAALAAARELNVAVRVYVPYGSSFLPYALGQVRRNPRVVWWLFRDLVGGVSGG